VLEFVLVMTGHGRSFVALDWCISMISYNVMHYLPVDNSSVRPGFLVVDNSSIWSGQCSCLCVDDE
jgi:hypothetical protein